MIDRIERVSLRDVWPHEAYDFTQWLEENIDVLSDAVDISIVSAEREKKTESAFSVDLVAEDEAGHSIIIENQLEKSNHDHLGKLITYLTAMQATTAIWIVSHPRPEHVAAMTWLNESTSADFYLLKLEAIRIGASLPAPLLTLIVGPSDEGKSIGRSKEEMSERHQIRHRWWSQVVQHPGAHRHKHISPGKYTWIGLASGLRGVGYNYSVRKTGAAAEVYIDRGKGRQAENLHIFDSLQSRQDEIEAAFGGPLVWERLDSRRACRVSAKVPGGYRDPEDRWAQTQDRLTDAMNRLIDAVEPHIRAMQSVDFAELVSASADEEEDA